MTRAKVKSTKLYSRKFIMCIISKHNIKHYGLQVKNVM